ncbi:hypothetical protein AVEN_26294-1 [Araneus ventricosus]|uniref:Uncharacterized protein n=1 Tax=Araneus ventricosus TaxID=182803 RepID=A0A4Y2ANR0_ARAVE|nr:hypothetical protein AVEN_26294-1 [Araneus ventricosus]
MSEIAVVLPDSYSPSSLLSRNNERGERNSVVSPKLTSSPWKRRWAGIPGVKKVELYLSEIRMECLGSLPHTLSAVWIEAVMNQFKSCLQSIN